MLRALLNKDRPTHDVPVSVRFFLVLALVLQLIWHSQQELAVAEAEDLPVPMSADAYRMVSLSEPLHARICSKFMTNC